MKKLPLIVLGFSPFLLASALGGCSSDDDDTGAAGKGGSAGTAGSGGKSGSGGKGGAGSGGKSGSAGMSSGGSSGEGGAAASSGAPTEGGAANEAGSGGTTNQGGSTTQGGEGGGGGSAEVDCTPASLTGIPTIETANHSGAAPTVTPTGGDIPSGTYAKVKEDVYSGGTPTTNTKEVMVLDKASLTFKTAADAAIPSAGTYLIDGGTLHLILACGQTGSVGIQFDLVTGGFKTYGGSRVDTWELQ